jgi:hypothetical protein
MELLESCKAMNHPWPAACRGKADTISNQITHPASARPTPNVPGCSSSGFRHYRIESPIREFRVLS